MPIALKEIYNTVFVVSSASGGVLDGAALEKENRAVVRKYYDSVDDIPSIMDVQKPTYLTFNFLTCNVNGGNILNLPRLFSNPVFRASRLSSNVTGIKIMLDDRNGLGKIGPNMLEHLDHMEAVRVSSLRPLNESTQTYESLSRAVDTTPLVIKAATSLDTPLPSRPRRGMLKLTSFPPRRCRYRRA